MRNSHERTVRGSVDEVWALVETLGGEADRLWPGDRWPPMVLDQGVKAGSAGGHGFVRYSVDDVNRDGRTRSVTFRFAPGLGLVGTHRFDVEPIDGDAAHVRIRHVIDGRTEGKMRLLWPLAIEPLHDALLEDAFDGAEAALAGRRVERRRLPRRARLLHSLAAAATRRAGPADRAPERRRAADVTSAVLGGVGVLHAVWALGVPWPAGSASALSEAVVGTTTFPSVGATWTVVGLLGAAVLVVQSRVRPGRPWAVVPFPLADLGARVITGVLALRGAGGLVISALDLGHATAPFRTLDLAVYSPLCLALAWGTWRTWAARSEPIAPGAHATPPAAAR